MLEQQAAQAAAAVLVGDEEGDLGAVRREQLGGRQAGDPAADDRHQRGRPGVVRVEEVVDVEPTGLPAGGEETQPQRVHRDLLVQLEDGVAVVRVRWTGSRRSCRRRAARPRARRSSPAGRRSGCLGGHVTNVPEPATACQSRARGVRRSPRHEREPDDHGEVDREGARSSGQDPRGQGSQPSKSSTSSAGATASQASTSRSRRSRSSMAPSSTSTAG